MKTTIDSVNVEYSPAYITTKYTYFSEKVTTTNTGTRNIQPKQTQLVFKTSKYVPKIGLMMVGWGGNNGSTLTASILANKNNLKCLVCQQDVCLKCSKLRLCKSDYSVLSTDQVEGLKKANRPLAILTVFLPFLAFFFDYGFIFGTQSRFTHHAFFIGGSFG